MGVVGCFGGSIRSCFAVASWALQMARWSRRRGRLLLLLLPGGSSQTRSFGLQATVAAVAVAVADVVVAAAVDHSATDDTASVGGTTQHSAASPSCPAVAAASLPVDNLQVE